MILDICKYLIDSFKNVKVFCIRINANKLKTKFLFYCFLSFYSNSCFVYLLLIIFFHYDHFHQFVLQIYNHENINQFYNLEHYIVFACFFFQMTSLFLSALTALLLKQHRRRQQFYFISENASLMIVLIV